MLQDSGRSDLCRQNSVVEMRVAKLSHRAVQTVDGMQPLVGILANSRNSVLGRIKSTLDSRHTAR